MRALAALLVATAACTSTAPSVPTPGPTPEKGVLTIVALLDFSGPRAAIGSQQRNALQLWAEQPGRAGLKLHTVDVAGSEAKLLIELKRAAMEHADAVIVGAPVTYDDTFGRAVDLAGLPVMLLQPLAGDPAGRIGGKWAFALAPSIPRLAALQIDDALRRDVLVPSLVLTDGRDRVDPMASVLAAEAERRGLGTLTRIALGNDGSVPPVVRSSLSVLRSVHCLAPIAACSAVARESASLTSPAMIYLPFSTAAAEHLRNDRDLGVRAVWPSSRTLIPLTVLRRDEEHQRAAFLKDYGGRFNAWPDVHAALAYDALTLLAAAADRAGSDDRGALRDAVERITMPLIASTYTFTADRHAGAEPADLAVMRWEANAPAIAPTFGTVTPTPSATPVRTPSPSPSLAPSPSLRP